MFQSGHMWLIDSCGWCMYKMLGQNVVTLPQSLNARKEKKKKLKLALGYCCLGEVSQLLIPRIHLLFHFQCWVILWNKGLIMNLLWRKSIWRWLSLDSEDIIDSLGAESHMWRLQRQEMMRDPLELKDKCVSHSLLHLDSCFGWRTSTAAHISPLQLCSKATLHICISE